MKCKIPVQNGENLESNLIIQNGVKAEGKCNVGCPSRMELMLRVKVMQDVNQNGSSIKSIYEVQFVVVVRAQSKCIVEFQGSTVAM